jgi:hypothetical protein
MSTGPFFGKKLTPSVFSGFSLHERQAIVRKGIQFVDDRGLTRGFLRGHFARSAKNKFYQAERLFSLGNDDQTEAHAFRIFGESFAVLSRMGIFFIKPAFAVEYEVRYADPGWFSKLFSKRMILGITIFIGLGSNAVDVHLKDQSEGIVVSGESLFS